MAKSTFFWHFGRLLWTGCTYWHYSIKIFLGIFWHKSRVPTRGSWAPNGPCRLKNGSKSLKKWPKLPNFQKYFCGSNFFLMYALWVLQTCPRTYLTRCAMNQDNLVSNPTYFFLQNLIQKSILGKGNDCTPHYLNCDENMPH